MVPESRSQSHIRLVVVFARQDNVLAAVLVDDLERAVFDKVLERGRVRLGLGNVLLNAVFVVQLSNQLLGCAN